MCRGWHLPFKHCLGRSADCVYCGKTYMTHGLPLSPFGSEQSQSRKCDLFIFPPIHVSTEAPASDLLLSTLWGFYGYSFFFLSRKNKASSHFPSAVFACTAVSGINVSALEMPP